jgi:hypothetical protein
VRASCAGCHDSYRAEYRRQFRGVSLL